MKNEVKDALALLVANHEKVRSLFKQHEGEMFSKIRKHKKSIDLMALGEEMTAFQAEFSSRHEA